METHLAAKSLDRPWSPKSTVRIVRFIVFSQDSVNQSFSIPPANRIVVLLEGLGKIAFARAVGVDANDSLPLFLRVLNLPVHPFTVLCLRRDVHEQRTGPTNLGGEDVRLNVVGVIGVVRVCRVYRRVPEVEARLASEFFHLAEAVIILVNVADENILRVAVHDQRPPSSGRSCEG